jgi:hypothetical protein
MLQTRWKLFNAKNITSQKQRPEHLERFEYSDFAGGVVLGTHEK